ncbi:calcium-binding protein [Halotia branconii]|uniref:Calcium-binding protein n=1 Tax=Halotia branconii CENA392 TaxID=1539056 RepID=A0AAJ6P7I3_9CYAN|nr:calcium-binding protein [Halotia branconii]WGV23670.1 calcium-binding protein [Halotia branconii CENA392]
MTPTIFTRSYLFLIYLYHTFSELVLGTPASGSRVFAFIDGLAGNTSDFDLRVTTATDTLEYDDLDGDVLFGQSGFNPSIAGTSLTGVPSYLQVTRYQNSTVAEPYRLYAVVQPGIANATVETEGNDTLITANTASNNYFSGALSSTADLDFYAFTARAGDLVFLSLDADPLRNNTPFDGRLALLDSTNTILVNVNGGGGSSNTTLGIGSLTVSNPNYPSEGLVYRILTDGTYYARVNAASTSIGDYLLSIYSIAATSNSIQGTSGADVLFGTPSDDSINSGDGNDRIFGIAGNDTLNAGAGNDYVFGGVGNDIINGDDGNDFLYGEAGDDIINGGDGGDNLNGGAGSDTLNGGLGDDIYTVDADDTINENANQGIDQVNAEISWTLGNNLENLTLRGNAAINGTGNELNNQIFGNDAVNTLNGGGGNDWLLGKGGNDTLIGGDGNDRLDGGSGDDILNGGNGNDLYEVDSLNDQLIEAVDAGTDTVLSSVTWTLADNFENLTLIGTQVIDASGNSVNNRLQGNAANNVLSGLDGNDYLAGNNGDDVLIGGIGSDTLVGGLGRDMFDLADTRTGGFDTLVDFKVGDDTVLLSASDFGLTQSSGVLDSGLFVLGSIATNNTQRFIYNQTQGSLWFDSDGNGGNAAVQIASFSNRVALSNTDFLVFDNGGLT